MSPNFVLTFFKIYTIIIADLVLNFLRYLKKYIAFLKMEMDYGAKNQNTE